MNAWRFEPDSGLVLRSLPELHPQGHEVVFDVFACGLCRSDCRFLRPDATATAKAIIPGHEIVVADPGSGARGILWPGRACGACASCRQGRENLCRRMAVLGVDRDGGFAERVAAPAENLIPIKAGIPDRLAVLAEPVACCLNALQQIQLEEHARIAVFGAGPFGHLFAFLATRLGPVQAVLIDPDADRKQITGSFRDAAAIPLVERHAGPFDIAINATSSPTGFAQMLAALGPGGRGILFSGLRPTGATLTAEQLNAIHYRQLHLVGAFGQTRAQIGQALDLIDKHRDTLSLLADEPGDFASLPVRLAQRCARDTLFQSISLAPWAACAK